MVVDSVEESSSSPLASSSSPLASSSSSSSPATTVAPPPPSAGPPAYDVGAMLEQECVHLRPLSQKVWLGSAVAAGNRAFLDANRIVRVLNVSVEVKNFFDGDGGMQYHRVKIHDSPETDIVQHFEAAFAFLNEVRNAQGSARLR